MPELINVQPFIERLNWLKEYLDACLDHASSSLHVYEYKHCIMYVKFYACFTTKQGNGPLYPIKCFEDYICYKKRQKLLA